MYKIELDTFTIKNGEDEYTASAPTSLFSVLNEREVIVNP